jgi:hypothetical protein
MDMLKNIKYVQSDPLQQSEFNLQTSLTASGIPPISKSHFGFNKTGFQSISEGRLCQFLQRNDLSHAASLTPIESNNTIKP